jgi:hypothetical protein
MAARTVNHHHMSLLQKLQRSDFAYLRSLFYAARPVE